MKDRLLSFICACALLFTACSKEKGPRPEVEERFPVTLRVNSLSHDIEPMAALRSGAGVLADASDRSLSQSINYLLYYVFDENNRRVLEEVQYSTDPGFGQIDDFFGKGTYKVLILGRHQPFFDWYYDYNESLRFYSYALVDDMYFKEFALVVDDSEVELEVVLPRKSGSVQIEMTDQVPRDIKEIRFSITGVSDYFTPINNRGFNDQTVTRSVFYEPDGSSYTWDNGDRYTFYFFLDEDKETKATVRLSAINRNDEVVAVKVIENVPVAVNKRTKLRGRLFDATGNISAQSFSLSF